MLSFIGRNAKKIGFFQKLAFKFMKKKGFWKTLLSAITKHGKKAFKFAMKMEKKCPGITVAAGTAFGSVIGAFAHARAARHPSVDHMVVVEIGDGYFDIQSWPGLYKIHVEELDERAIRRLLYQIKAVRAELINMEGTQLVDVRVIPDSETTAMNLLAFQKKLLHEGFSNIQIDFKGNLKQAAKKEASQIKKEA